MLRKSFILLSVISLNILPGFASDEQQDEKLSFFPQKFTSEQLQQLISQGEVKDNFKVYRIEKEDQDILYSYSPYTVQLFTKYLNPLEGRVNFKQESYQTIDEHSIKLFEGYKKTGVLKTFVGKYALQGAYEKESSTEISITGSYDIFRLIFSNEKFNENGLCLHRLHELDGTFTGQTNEAHRLNQTLSKLFYMLKALQQPEKYPLTYNETAEELGRKWFVEYMRTKEISAEKCMAVLLKGKVVDSTLLSLEAEFYTRTLEFLRHEIYSLMGIDCDLLGSMYEGIGEHMINYDYTVTTLAAGQMS
ncbi:hypothetical protein IM40_00225 [Candidatus Paracaedimonas acanthamoebae]|nr:hypothetical protein IM40_00225 [Candidatus Paracaedimonas acanthamoebae]